MYVERRAATGTRNTYDLLMTYESKQIPEITNRDCRRRYLVESDNFIQFLIDLLLKSIGLRQ